MKANDSYLRSMIRPSKSMKALTPIAMAMIRVMARPMGKDKTLITGEVYGSSNAVKK